MALYPSVGHESAAAESIATSTSQTVKQAPSVKSLIIEAFGSGSVMLRIASCESTGSAKGTPRHFGPGGKVLRGKINPKDVGVFQVNEHYHLKDSIKLGYDIYTVKGNIGYAKHLLKTQGTRPWNWSKHCWR